MRFILGGGIGETGQMAIARLKDAVESPGRSVGKRRVIEERNRKPEGRKNGKDKTIKQGSGRDKREMAKSIKGTKTEKNLLAAFAGEAQARNRYTYFASAAKKEGFEQISAIFLETADNEKEHAKIFFKYLEGGDVEITAAYPAGVIGNTAANLEAAARGEKHEWSTLYADFERVARAEGLPEIADSFREIAEVEQVHETRYRKLLANIVNGEVFRKKSPVKWHCRNCGYVHEGAEAPEECPACRHPRAHYEVLAENY